MKAGPWTSYAEVCPVWGKFIRTPSFDGKLPVAVERRNHEARLLYERPSDDREPSPIAHGIREYAWRD